MADLFSGDTFFQIEKNLAVDIARGFTSETHEFEFVRGFVSAAGDRDGVRRYAFKGRRGGAEMVVEGERQSFLDPEAAGAEIFINQRCGDELCGTLVFLPDADFGGIAHEFAHADFFESGRDEKRLTGARDEESEETLAESPADAGEVVQRSARSEEDGVEFRVETGHEFLGVDEAVVKLLRGNGMDAIAKGFQ